MKKLVSIFLIFALAFSLVACDNGSKSFGKSRSEYSLETTTDKELGTVTVTDIEANKFYSSTTVANNLPTKSEVVEINSTTTLVETNFSTETITNSFTPETKIGFSDTDIEKIGTQLHKLINNKRSSNNLSAFTINKTLKQASKIRSLEIQTKWSHVRPDGTSFTTSVNQNEQRFNNLKEIIAYASVNYVSINSQQDIENISNSLFECIISNQVNLVYYLDPQFTTTGLTVSCLVNEENNTTTFYICQILAQ